MVSHYQGSCLCGAVRFEVDEFAGAAGHCHCSMCRKFHGAAYATLASVPKSAFRWQCGEDQLSEFKAPNGTTRSFCRHCGSSLFFSSPKGSPDVLEVALAVFDDDVPVTPDAHIFVGSAAHWTKLADGLPCYLEGRNSRRMTE